MHDLDKYVFLWRARYFINVLRSRDENYNIVRGSYIVYPKDNRLIHCYDSNFYAYPKFNPKVGGFKGSFKDVECFDNMDKYEESQKEIMENKYLEKPSDKDNKDYEQLNRLVQKVGVNQAAEIMGCHRNTIRNRLKNFEQAQETIQVL